MQNYNVMIRNQDYAIQIIIKQLIRSATSVGANIAEAQASSTRKDFMNFLNYSLKSVNESLFWLTLLKDLGGASLITLRNK